MRIGVLGGGQLGRMLALAGIPLGIEFVFYDSALQACTSGLGKNIIGEFDNLEQLAHFSSLIDVATIETENIPVTALQHINRKIPVLPDSNAVLVAQDRLKEKNFFSDLGIPTPIYYDIDNADTLSDTIRQHADALFIKSRRFGYDGKGQALLSNPDEAGAVWSELGEVPLIAEQRIHFSREVSVIAVRSRSGATRFYPLVENVHKHGILLRSRPLTDDPLQASAEEYAGSVIEALGFVGTLAFEFFVCDNKLVANEIAPRVHNSGHWTIEGAVTSQFENHIRAISDWPLGSTDMRDNCIMYNLIGKIPDPESLLGIPDLHLHDYGKTPRAGRKLGHITLCNPKPDTIALLEDILEWNTADYPFTSTM